MKRRPPPAALLPWSKHGPLAGTAGHQAFRIVAAEDEAATIYLYEEIGFWGITAEEFVKELTKVTASTIHLRVNSPGGDVFDARAMIAALNAHHATVIAHVDGVAASAASYLVLACDEVEIEPGAMLMIHRPWGFAVGDADEMRSTASVLDQIEGSMLDDYERETGQSRDQIKAWMDAETWFTAEEAVTYGFADRIAGEKEEPAAEPTPETEEAASARLAAQAKARRAHMAARLRLAEVQ